LNPSKLSIKEAIVSPVVTSPNDIKNIIGKHRINENILSRYEDVKNIFLDNDEIRFNVRSAEDFIPDEL
jgi:hypothetical protein